MMIKAMLMTKTKTIAKTIAMKKNAKKKKTKTMGMERYLIPPFISSICQIKNKDNDYDRDKDKDYMSQCIAF